VRVAPDRVLFKTPAAWPDIHTSSKVTKGRAYLVFMNDSSQTLLTAFDKELHRKKRAVIAPVVSERNMRVFETQMSNEIDKFLLRLWTASRDKEAVNMSVVCERLAVDVVGRLGFGYSLDTQADPSHRAVIEGIKHRTRRGTMWYKWNGLRLLDRVFDWMDRKSVRERADYLDILRTMIGRRMAVPPEQAAEMHDFWASITKTKEAQGEAAEAGMVGKNVWFEALFFIFAGGSTTATLMSGVFFYLSRNPEPYRILAEEIRSTFASGREISQGPKLAGCKYLRAVLDETLRLSPSAMTPAWREQDRASVAAGEVFVVDGHVIPPGTQVGVSHYALQHDPAYFSDPDSFRPERWISEMKGDLTADKRAFYPFSLGERNCAGRSMAYLEASLAVARTVWYFDFEKVPVVEGRSGEGDLLGKTRSLLDRGNKGEFQLCEGIAAQLHDGPNLAFRPREGVELGELERAESKGN